MNIGVLAWEPDEHESLHLREVGRRMGHDVFLFDLDDVRTDGHAGGTRVWIGERRPEDVDVILSRAHLRADRWRSDEELLILLSELGRPPLVHPAHVHVPVKSKLVLMRRLAAAGIPVPATALCRTVEEVGRVARALGSVVVKPSYGHGGGDVHRLNGDVEAHRPLLAGLLARHRALLVQPYVPHPAGDVRTVVVGDDIPLAFRRVPPPGGWRTNVAQGARVEPCTPTPAVRELSLRVARLLGLGITGLDVVERGGDLLLFEANTSPGWYPVSRPEQEVVAERCIEHVVRCALRAASRAASP